MKKVLPIFAILIVMLSFWSCKPSEVDGKDTIYLTIEEKDLLPHNVPARASVINITVKCSGKFTATSSASDWCRTTITEQSSNNLKIDVSANTESDVRTAKVTLRTEGLDPIELTVRQLGEAPAILVRETAVDADPSATEFMIQVTTNVPVEFEIPQWVTPVVKGKAMVTTDYYFLCAELPLTENQRKGDIVIKGAEGVQVKSVTVPITQFRSSNVDPDEFPADEKQRIASVNLVVGTQQTTSGQESSQAVIDGDYGTFYHSRWSPYDNMKLTDSVVMEFAMQAPSAIDYFMLVPRSSHSNGVFQTGKIYVKTTAHPTWALVHNINLGGISNSPSVIKLTSRMENVTHVRLRADAGQGGDKPFVTLAEFECFVNNSAGMVDQYAQYFTDKSFSELAPGVTLAQINTIDNATIGTIARQLYEKTYPEFRVTVAEPYRPIEDLAKELKTSTYSAFENPTGIYFQQGDDVIVFVGDTHGEKISLRVTDFNVQGQPTAVYALNEGVNRLKITGEGNGYIPYYTMNYKTAKPIKVNISNGRITGYFDSRKHTNADYRRILAAAVSPVFDARGENSQIVFHTARFRSGAPGDGVELLKVYDSVVQMEWRLMGLQKYNRVPKNRMFTYVAVGAGTAAAGGWGAMFPPSWTGTQTNTVELINTSWGLAHELGHVNQVRPGMKFIGSTEVTNNIYSSWVQWNFTPNELRLEHENISGLDGLGNIIGGRFNAFLNSGIVKKQIWQNQDGPDRSNAIKEGSNTNPPTVTGADFFVRLVPLWQLQLYFHIAGEGNSWHKPYFWADVFEAVRVAPNNNNEAYNMLQMMRNLCDATKHDLSHFFAETGILRTRDLYQDDYTPARLTITAADSTSIRAYASKYPKPETDYIYYISGNTVKCYKNKLAVSGVFNTGVNVASARATISHSVWKNAVVFEAYSGNKLTKIAMAGTGTKNYSSTTLSYPAGCTRIEAVAWDGERTLVYGNR